MKNDYQIKKGVEERQLQKEGTKVLSTLLPHRPEKKQQPGKEGRRVEHTSSRR